MNLVDTTVQSFAAGGLLSRMAMTFQARRGQIDMARAVAETISHGGALVVEAGTGTGKTFAYLLPALLSGKRVLVSTATKTLQDQLHRRDIPVLAGLLGLPIRLALLKGRSSYLCLERMELARQGEGQSFDRTDLRAVARIERWAQGTQTGDLAEVSGLDERSSVIPAVTSTRDNCLGSDCPKAKGCFVNLARKEALAADVVVVNHHLFFADIAVRESGVAELLPSVDVVVLDEAHTLNETGIQFLGNTLSSHQVFDLIQDALAAGLTHARGLHEWHALAASLENAMRDLRLSAAGDGRAGWGGGRGQPRNVRVNWFGRVPDGLEEHAWDTALGGVQTAATELRDALLTVTELSPELARLAVRTDELVQRCAVFVAPCPTDAVRWLDAGNPLRLVQSPLDVAVSLRGKVWPPPVEPDEGIPPHVTESSRKSWIFTSATLGDDESLSWFTQACGLQEARVLRVASPFDYPNQAALYVPRQFAAPSDANHSHAVAALAARVAAELGGRTLILTTSLRALQTISDHLPQHLPSHLLVLTQGTAPKRELIERFRSLGADGGSTTPPSDFAYRGAVLVGSASFWEGVDLPGRALQAVVIDKLPFPSPGDPLVQARSRRISEQGGNAFAGYQLSEAAVALKQGAGRLIRHEEDMGVLIVTDPRLAQASYGRRLQAALPPMQRLADEGELIAWVRQMKQVHP